MTLNIQKKIALIMAIFVFFSVIIISTISYFSSKSNLREAYFAQLTSVREMKKRNIENYFEQINLQVSTLSEDRMIVDAMKSFKSSFSRQVVNYGSQSYINKKESVENYFKNEFAPRLKNQSASALNMIPDDSLTVYFQSQYLSENSNPVGDKDNLQKGSDNNEYNDVHSFYHPIIRNYQQAFGYYDIFLIDVETNHVVYSVFKEVDFATSLTTGPFSKTNFADSYKMAKAAKSSDFVNIQDFKKYAPSYNAPAGFISSPVFDEGSMIGVLVFQFPVDKINAIMTGNEGWKNDGLGESGESYIVGDDFTMKSVSRFLMEDKDNYLKALADANVKQETIDEISQAGTSILFQKVETEASKSAIQGQSDIKLVKDYRNVEVLSAYAPLEIAGVKWVLLAEIDASEAFAPIVDLRNNMLLVGVIVLLITILISFMVARQISNPIIALTDSLELISQGDLTQKLEVKSADEIGRVSEAMNKMISNLKNTAQFAKNIGEGNYDSTFKPLSEKDILGTSLIEMKDSLQKVAVEDQIRNWAISGMAKFGDILRNNHDSMEKLGDDILINLVKYLKANQGALYVVDGEADEEQNLKLIACYAWERKKYISGKTLEKGEGLVGQVWLERQSVYLKDIPKNYITITSGLGNAVPQCIYIVPLVFNDEVYGIIEIASFNDLKSHEREFLDSLGESIASTLSTVKINARTQKLLVQSQEMMEESGAQEEELRQNMEEIQATQEQMERTKGEHLAEISRLQQLHDENIERYKMLSLVADHTNNSVVITDKNGLIVYVNHGFTKLTGYVIDEVKGKKPGSFLQGKDTDQDTIARLRDKIAAVEPFYEEILNYDKEGKEYWISMSINPVLEDGELVNYVSVQANITESKQKSLDQESQVKAIDNNLAIIEFDLQGNIQIANENFLKTMGYTLVEIQGKHHSMFMKKDEIGKEYEQMWENLRNGNTVYGEFQRVNSNGDLVWLKSHYTPIKDIVGRTYKIMKYAQDVTAGKILALDFDCQMTAISKNNALIEFDMDGIVITANENFLHAMGYTLDEIKGQHHKLFLFKQDINDHYQAMWQQLNEGHSITRDFKRKSKDGKVVWLSSTYTPIIDLSGKPYKVVKYATDITTTKIQTLDYQSQLEAIGRNYAVIEFDLEGNIQEVNQNFLDAMMYSRDEVVGKHHSMFVFDDDLQNGYSQMWLDLAKGKSQSAKFRRKNKKGEAIWLNSIYTPIIDLSGKPYKVVKYAQRIDN